ncbi:uncharacterized protein JCM6883_002016 [Sporobolomyces salmoneus]|uniref:uncharacterized protein n=1 Tax=Sporobolomyces salmoneus TaxID=183962 RepID=UPI0031755A7F
MSRPSVPSTALEDLSLDSPTDFISASLSSLDSSLRCQICHELFTAPVLLTTCNHTFDSLCLRNHLKEIKKCPQCGKEANEDRIRRNLGLEEVGREWRNARNYLIQLEKSTTSTQPSTPPIASTSNNLGPPSAAPTPSIATRGSSKRKLVQQSPPPASSTSSRKKIKPEPSSSTQQVRSLKSGRNEEELAVDDSSDIEVIEDFGMNLRKRQKRESSTAMTTSSQRKGKGKLNGNGSERGPEGDLKDPSILVTCPVCSKLVKNGSISAHIDSNCVNFVYNSSTTNSNGLNGMGKGGKGKGKTENAFGRLMGNSNGNGNGYHSSDDTPSSNPSTSTSIPQDTTKYLPLPNYAHKKLKDLESLLKALNLPTSVPSSHSKTPDQKVSYLKKRHSQYLTVWNANVDIDVKDPKHLGVKGLKDELRNWEKVLLEEEKKGKSKSKNVAGGGDTVSCARLNMNMKTQEMEFRELIALARKSHLRDKEKRERQKQEQEQAKGEEVKESVEATGVDEEKLGEAETKLDDENIGKVGINEDNGDPTAAKKSPPEPTTIPELEEIEQEPEEKQEDEKKMKIDDENADSRTPAAVPISALPLEDRQLEAPSRLVSDTAVVTDSSASPPRRRTVRIQTPPPLPSSSPLSPLQSDRIPTPPLPRTHSNDQEDDAGEEEDDSMMGRGERSSSILEYDEKFFPPTSQRVREVDWEMVRKAREEERGEEEETEVGRGEEEEEVE